MRVCQIFSEKSSAELRKIDFSQCSGNFIAIRDRRWKARDMLFSASIGSWGRLPTVLELQVIFWTNSFFLEILPHSARTHYFPAKTKNFKTADRNRTQPLANSFYGPQVYWLFFWGPSEQLYSTFSRGYFWPYSKFDISGTAKLATRGHFLAKIFKTRRFSSFSFCAFKNPGKTL